MILLSDFLILSLFFFSFCLCQVLFEGTIKQMKAQVEVFWIEGGSHGLAVKGRSEDSVLDDVNLQVVTWMREQGA